MWAAQTATADGVLEREFVLELLAAETRVEVTRVGYLGMSMGARFGLPLAATLGVGRRDLPA